MTMDFKEQFNHRLSELINEKGHNCFLMTSEKYAQVLREVKEAKSKDAGKTPIDYRRLKSYDYVKVGGCEKLIYPNFEDGTNMRFYVSTDEIFAIVHETHLANGHGGRNVMMKELQKKYKNITTQLIMIYISLCEECQRKPRVLVKHAKDVRMSLQRRQRGLQIGQKRREKQQYLSGSSDVGKDCSNCVEHRPQSNIKDDSDYHQFMAWYYEFKKIENPQMRDRLKLDIHRMIIEAQGNAMESAYVYEGQP